MQFIRAWIVSHLSDPQVVGLSLLLVAGFAGVMFFGNMLAPAIAAVIVAYLLEGPVQFLQKRRSPRLISVAVVFIGFLAFCFAVTFGLLPLLYRQVRALIQQVPTMLGRGQEALLSLPEKYPEIFSEEQVRGFIRSIGAEVTVLGQNILSASLASVVGLLTLIVYLILVPLMVFFFLKDKRRIIEWMVGFLPQKRNLAAQVWHEVDIQIGNYVRGKVIEILIVWLVTFITFSLLRLNFAMLLSVLVGLSVLIPYIGAVVVTVPVALIAYFQWGLTTDFAWLLGAYLVIQALDGNVLVPLLFSEVVNLHPVAIIVAVLIFGGLWGFWGVFFAIPLATLVQAVIRAWPHASQLEDSSLREQQRAASDEAQAQAPVTEESNTAS